MFIYVKICTRIASACMVSKVLMVLTRKKGRVMMFLMFDFPILVCVKTIKSEGENSFFRFFQLDSFRSEYITKSTESEWMTNSNVSIPFKPTTFFTV